MPTPEDYLDAELRARTRVANMLSREPSTMKMPKTFAELEEMLDEYATQHTGDALNWQSEQND